MASEAKGRAQGPARHHPIAAASPPSIASSEQSVTDPMPLAVAIGELFERSDERDRYERRVRQAWSEGWLAGHDVGWRGGYAQAEREMAESWQTVTRSTLAIADPTGPEARESAIRRVTAAERGARRDAEARERSYLERAFATRPERRTPEQAAAIRWRQERRRQS